MAMVEKALVLLMMIMVAAQVSNAAEYKVGDSAGWTTTGHVNYKKWAAEKRFQIGDTIVFEYNPQFENVVRVKNHRVYNICDASSPIETYTSGKDTIKITKHGHHFFVCSVPGHCNKGQKVDINVLKQSPPPATSPSSPPTVSPSPPATSPSPPTVSPSPPAPAISPAASDSPAPSPTRSNASPMNVGKGAFGFLGLAMTVFSIFYF